MILVIGAGGSVGGGLLAELRESGVSCRAAFHSADRTAASVAAGQPAVTIDLAERATLAPAMSDVDTVFLMCGTGPAQTGNELNAVAAAVATGVRRVVKLSVWRADEELTPIARLHRPVEQAIEASGLAYTFLRPNFYLQNFARQAGEIRATGAFSQPIANAPISFIDVGDVARSAARVVTEDGHDKAIYDLTGPAALTYDEMAEVLTAELGRPVRFTGLSDEQALAGLRASGVPDFHARALVEVGQAYRDGGAERVTDTVRALTGRAPTSAAEFVRANRALFG
jgi:uncharacterized protein YbjT (DUF2867 family)